MFARYLALEIRRISRDRRFVIFTIAIPIAFYLLWTAVYGHGSGTQNGLSVKVYLMVSMGCFGAVGASLTSTGARLAAERQGGWLQRLQVTLLRPWTVICAKAIAAMTLALPSIVSVGVVAALAEGVRLPAADWAGLIAATWTGALPFAALGVLIGSVVGQDAAQPLTIGIYMLLSALGGLWWPVSVLPGTLRTVAHVLPSNHYANLAWTVAGGHAPGLTDVAVLAAWALGLAVVAAAAYRRVTVIAR
jgi:ABC-2 type transport system permease protein